MGDLVGHYTRNPEDDRLAAGPGLLERDRTRDVLSRFLPAAPARVADVGGGSGVYATWLASQGYRIDLVDLVPRHVERARELLAGGTAAVADARALPFADGGHDAVILLGPLYHLVSREDRLRALSEARRIARPGAPIVAAAISRFASALDGLARRLIDDPVFRDIVDRDLSDGRHENPTDHPDYFTTAYFHRPEELRPEMEAAGLRDVTVLAVEGPAWLLPDLGARWQDERHRALVCELLRRIEAEPALHGASAHLLAIGRR